MKFYPSLCVSSRPVYEAPSVEVIEIVPESLIAASGEAPDMEHGWDLDF